MLLQFDQKLDEFGLKSTRDIVAATGDGAAVMIAFGNKSNFEYFTCLNHTIHLSVLAALFPNKKNFSETSETPIDLEESSEVMEEHFVIKELYSETIERMSKIIRFFRNSPVRNDLLQETAKRCNLKQLQLVMFTKTRWNSMVISGQRFLLMLPAVLSTLSDVGTEGLQWFDDDTKTLKVFINIVVNETNITICLLI